MNQKNAEKMAAELKSILPSAEITVESTNRFSPDDTSRCVSVQSDELFGDYQTRRIASPDELEDTLQGDAAELLQLLRTVGKTAQKLIDGKSSKAYRVGRLLTTLLETREEGLKAPCEGWNGSCESTGKRFTDANLCSTCANEKDTDERRRDGRRCVTCYAYRRTTEIDGVFQCSDCTGMAREVPATYALLLREADRLREMKEDCETLSA